ncbi:MAG: mitochondrial fission ELM1 family protein [Pseudomonadota bacterium]
MPEPPWKTVVVTDGRAGNEAQALALAEALSRAVPVVTESVQVESASWATALPPAVLHGLGLALTGLRTRLPEGADLLIGAGRRAGPVVAAAGRRSGAATVQLMAPQMPLSAFSLVVAPSHDGLEGPNVLSSIGALSRITKVRVNEAARTWPRSNLPPEPRLAVLVGGPSKSAEFEASDWEHLIALLNAASKTHSLLITPSRRTPEDLQTRLIDQFAADHFVWDGSGANPYPGLLRLVEAVLVTADSVNMASEAASTGLPVHVMPVTKLAPKLAKFHADLEARGASRQVALPLQSWAYDPLAEADRAAEEVIKRLGWDS